MSVSHHIPNALEATIQELIQPHSVELNTLPTFLQNYFTTCRAEALRKPFLKGVRQERARTWAKRARYEQVTEFDCMSAKNAILIAQELNNTGVSRVLDLGSGSGFPTWFFSQQGIRAYGVEENKQLVRFAQRQQATIKQITRKDVRTPQYLCANYTDKSFWKSRFDDNTSPKDMDAFVCFAYKHYKGENDHEQLLVDTLRKHVDRPQLIIVQ